MTDRQLWMWMLGRGRKAQLTSKLKPGTVPVPCEMLVILHSCLTVCAFLNPRRCNCAAWQRWLRQGRTAEFVREQPRQRAMEDRHSTASGQEQRDTFHRSYWTQVIGPVLRCNEALPMIWQGTQAGRFGKC